MAVALRLPVDRVPILDRKVHGGPDSDVSRPALSRPSPNEENPPRREASPRSADRLVQRQVMLLGAYWQAILNSDS